MTTTPAAITVSSPCHDAIEIAAMMMTTAMMTAPHGVPDEPAMMMTMMTAMMTAHVAVAECVRKTLAAATLVRFC